MPGAHPMSTHTIIEANTCSRLKVVEKEKSSQQRRIQGDHTHSFSVIKNMKI